MTVSERKSTVRKLRRGNNREYQINVPATIVKKNGWNVGDPIDTKGLTKYEEKEQSKKDDSNKSAKDGI